MAHRIVQVGRHPNGTRRLRARFALYAGATAVILAGAAVWAAPRLAISPLAYQVVSVTETSSGATRAFDVTLRAGILNFGDPALNVTAQLSSATPLVVVLDGDLRFGDVPTTRAGRPVVSRDTFRLRLFLPRERPLLALYSLLSAIVSDLQWRIGCDNCGPAENRTPVADAGADQTARVGQPVQLDGSASMDPEGSALTYQWTLLSRPTGSSATIVNTAAVRSAITPDRSGHYEVQLVVSDGTLTSAPDTVRITTLNSPPVADAGADGTAVAGDTVALDGTRSSDVDGDPLTYAWSIVSKPNGSAATVADPSAPQTGFTTDVQGRYVVQLVVHDGISPSDPDDVVVDTRVSNRPPVAAAGSDQSLALGAQATLDGSASSDPDGNALTYAWSFLSRPALSQATLGGANSPGPAFTLDQPGDYVIQLTVSDGQLSASDTVVVSTLNSGPVARAGSDQLLHAGGTVSLDGSASTDADGDALAFKWALVNRPNGSAAALSNVGSSSVTFVADTVGLYTVQLIVNDGAIDSTPAVVNITATNTAPVANDDTTATTAGTAVTIMVLANDSDADGDPLTIAAVTQPARGTSVISATSVVYTPAAGFTGTDSFTYDVGDGFESRSAVVTVTIEAAPVVDSDGDGIDDDRERQLGTDPLKPDSDADGLSDGREVNQTLTNPLDSDTDDDGYIDGDEVLAGTDPRSAASAPSFQLALETSAVSVFVDSETLLPFTIARDLGFLAPIDVRLSTSPDGVSAAPVRMTGALKGSVLALRAHREAVAGAYEIEVTAASGTTTRTRRVLLTIRPPEPRAQEKIIAALEAGTIDGETALLYRAYALFGDPRLPQVYRGSGSIEEDGTLLFEIAAALDVVSPESRTKLESFLLRPSDPNSWYSQVTGPVAFQPPAAPPLQLASLSLESAFAQANPPPLPETCSDERLQFTPGWISQRVPGIPVRIWVQCGSDEEGALISRMIDVMAVFQLIWPEMTGTPMGPPKPDRAPGDRPTLVDTTGDESIDVYLIMTDDVPRGASDGGLDSWPLPANAAAGAYPWRCPETVDCAPHKKSGFMILPIGYTVSQPRLHATVIHEFFHLQQYAHNADLRFRPLPGFGGMGNAPESSWWFIEASATWASAHFDRVINNWGAYGRQAFDEVYEDHFLNGFQKRSPSIKLNDQSDNRPYEAFIWPYFMEQRRGAGQIGQVWVAAESAATHREADDAMDGVFPFAGSGGNFREFAVRALNIQLDEALPDQRRFVSLDPSRSGGFGDADSVEPAAAVSHTFAEPTAGGIGVGAAPLAAQYHKFDVEGEAIRRIEFDLRQFNTVRSTQKLDLDAFIGIKGQPWKHRELDGEEKLVFCMDDPADKLESLWLIINNHGLNGQDADTTIPYTATDVPCPMKWEGTATYDHRYKIAPNARTLGSADITWVRDPFSPGFGYETYYATGSITIDSFSANGCLATIIPRTATVERGWGSLVIDYTQTPPVATGGGAGTIIATIRDCDDHEQPGTPLGVLFFQDPVLLNDAEDEIKAQFSYEDPVSQWTLDFTYRRKFDKDSPSEPPPPQPPQLPQLFR